jgi:hypothetical protein
VRRPLGDDSKLESLRAMGRRISPGFISAIPGKKQPEKDGQNNNNPGFHS